MSIMVGATTHKFLMIAAAMILPVRVDHERAEAVIDADVPVSVISTKLAERLHIDDGNARTAAVNLRKPINIAIGAEAFSVASVLVDDAPFEDDVHRGKDVILGNDMLRTHVFAIDVAKRTVKVVLPYERDHEIRNFHSVPVIRDGAGKARISVSLNGAAPVQVWLDLGEQAAIAMGRDAADQLGHDHDGKITNIRTLSIGGVDIQHVPVVIQNDQENPQLPKVGVGIFRSPIVLDFPHNLVWFK